MQLCFDDAQAVLPEYVRVLRRTSRFLFKYFADFKHLRSAVAAAVGRSHEGHRRGPEPSARAQSQGHTGDVQGAAGTVHRDAVARIHLGRYRFLKGWNRGTTC